MTHQHLIEKHIITKNHMFFSELQDITHKSKNLYNAGLYQVRQHYFQTKKYLKYSELASIFTKTDQPDFINLPRKVSQQTLKLVDQNFKSFFGSLKAKKSGQIKTEQRISLPKYLNKDGFFVTLYTNQAISSKRPEYIKLSGTNIYIKTDKTRIQQVRIVPKTGHFSLEIIYLRDIPELKSVNGKYASIDLGLNNLAAVGGNSMKHFIINGRPLKSINQYYNKKLAYLKSILKTRNQGDYSTKTRHLSLKRNSKIMDYMHKTSAYIINQLVSNDISVLFIGENKNWKQEINIGKRNNQNFVQVPFDTLKNQLKYKAKLQGIQVLTQEESYTSKASFLSSDNIPVYGKEKTETKFSGYRAKRGLYKDKILGKNINADINGMYNILRKAVGDFKFDPIEVCSTPAVITVKFN